MNARNILYELFKQRITIEQAEDFLSNVLDSLEADKVESLLMLTRLEWTAYAQGITLEDLARWRYQSWPTRCAQCGREIEIEKFGWKVVSDACDVSVLKHIKCP